MKRGPFAALFLALIGAVVYGLYFFAIFMAEAAVEFFRWRP